MALRRCSKLHPTDQPAGACERTARLPFSDIDSPAVIRALQQIADRPEDLCDVFFERREELELPPDDVAPGFRARRESGLAIRLTRGDQTWLAGRDRISSETFDEALRRAARAMPRASYPRPQLNDLPWREPIEADELLSLPAAVRRVLADHGARFEVRLTVRRHRRWTRVLGNQLNSATEREAFYSYQVEAPWGRSGGLLAEANEAAARRIADAMVRSHKAHGAAPPKPWNGAIVLGSDAAAVLLHEAVAHALEADTLALGGHPEAAIGVQLGSELLDVFDDPGSAPEGVRRRSDDEGFPAARRLLLRGGKVEQPLCDSRWGRRSERLLPGAARRGSRHLPPGPRSTHLVLGSGEHSQTELLSKAEGGIYLPTASRGRLDPMSGDFQLEFPFGYRISEQTLGETVGKCRLRGHVSDLLHAVTGVGSEVRAAGAGWCAKGGVKLPVWATTPALLLEGLEVRP